jgi:phytoene dehydrogenase-like protein
MSAAGKLGGGGRSLNQHYDVVVVGTRTSGIIAAALLAKRGRRVLLVDHGESTTTYRHQGLDLPLVPHLLPSLEHAPHAQRVHDELALGPTLRAQMVPLQVAFQAVLPNHRIDIRQSPAALATELQRELGMPEAPLQLFLQRLFALDAELTEFLRQMPPLPPSSLWERLTSHRLMAQARRFCGPFDQDPLFAQMPADHPLRLLTRGPLPFFGNLWTEAPSTFQAVRLLAGYFRGATALPGGVDGLNTLLLQAARYAGVTFRRGAVVRGISVQRRRLVELELEDERYTQTGQFFIDNTHAAFAELLPAKARSPRYIAQSQAVAPVGGLMVVNLIVRPEVIPCGMAHALFLLNGRQQARGDAELDPPLLLQRSPAQGPAASRSAAEPGQEPLQVLSVACPVRVADVAHSPERLDGLKKQMLGRVGRVVPFLESHLAGISLPSDTASWELQTQGAAPSRRVDTWRLNPLYELAEPPLLGVAGRPVGTALANLVHCGPDVVPGLGLEGEYIAGLGAVARLEKMAGRAWRL